MPTGPDPLFPHFKPVRNLIRRFEPESLVNHFLGALRKAHRGGVEVVKSYQPWQLLLAITWTFKEQDSLAHRRPRASLNDAHKVLNLIYKMADADTGLDQIQGLRPLMRRLAYQQFWLGRPDGAAVSRQELLFGALPQNHQFNRTFEATTEISIGLFLDLAFATIALLLGKDAPEVFKLSNFADLVNLPEGAKEKFLGLLSRSSAEWAVKLQDKANGLPSLADQFILRSPLFKAPLLKSGELYISYFPPLIYRFLENSIYRTLRDLNPEKFMQSFGPMFERYVEACLRDAGLSFKTERELQTPHKDGNPPKCVDFVIEENAADILIDAKGVEMSARGRVTWRSDVIYGATKTSVVKAIIQGMSVSRLLNPMRPARGPITPVRESFLLIVTYEPLYLGNGRDLWDSLGSSLPEKPQGEFAQPWPIATDNIYCITIRELETLLEYCRHQGKEIGTVLRKTRTADAEPRTRRFLLSQHLESLGDTGPRLPMLRKALDRLADRSVKLLPAEQQIPLRNVVDHSHP